MKLEMEPFDPLMSSLCCCTFIGYVLIRGIASYQRQKRVAMQWPPRDIEKEW